MRASAGPSGETPGGTVKSLRRLRLRLRLAAVAMCALTLTAAASAPAVRTCTVDIARRYPHDRAAFTEGLVFRDGIMFESTGLEGRSTIRAVDLASGRVLRETVLPPQLFGEGIVDWGREIISLTWQNRIGFRWDRATLRQTGSFRYDGEGWALTRSARDIYMSDGTDQLRVLDPVTLAVRRRISVTANGRPQRSLNEIEWVDGAILANIWFSDRVARIDPASGRITAWIDMSALRRDAGAPHDDVLNGIAWDRASHRMFVTGKNWPTLYEVRLRGC